MFTFPHSDPTLQQPAGIGSLALVPTASGVTSRCPPCAQRYPDLYAGVPDLPFPLELVALCMLRTLRRKVGFHNK